MARDDDDNEAADGGVQVADGGVEDGGDQAEASHGPRECMPCRGTGQVISNLGGEPSKVACPWCDGSGMRRTGVDTQEKWLEADATAAGK